MTKPNSKKSKRMTCRRKYKIIKKVAEHNRKLRREAKKNRNKRKPKDPGVPNSLPFKDEIIREAELQKQRAKELREAQKAKRLKGQMEDRGLEDLADETTPKVKQLNEEVNIKQINFKSSFNDFKKVIELADVVLEVLDARDPLGSRCPQIEEMIVNSGKKLVLLLNKIDLIPRSNLDSWLKYLRQELPTIAFKSIFQLQNTRLSKSKNSAARLAESLKSSSKCVGAPFLMKVLGNYCQKQNIQTSIKVGVVGFPNVGKSCVISSLKEFRSVNPNADVTKSIQEVSLDKHVIVLDPPGTILAKDRSSATLALRNVVKIETLEDVIAPAEAIVERLDHNQLRMHYTFPEFSSCHDLLVLFAKRLGKYRKGGEPKHEEGAKRLIKDWNQGYIKYYVNPPEEYKPSAHLNSSLVVEMYKEFIILPSEEQMELDKAPEVFPSKGVLAQPTEPTEGLMSDTEEMDAD